MTKKTVPIKPGDDTEAESEEFKDCLSIQLENDNSEWEHGRTSRDAFSLDMEHGPIDDDSSQASSVMDITGIIITFGKEQFLSPPALLLLCPLISLFVIFAFLDLEDWRWRACLEDRAMRRHCYGYQAFLFALLLLIGMQFYGDRIVEESFGEGQQTIASRLYQRELAVLILACGTGLLAIENTLAEETSIFATSFGCFLIFSGALHKGTSLPFVTWIAFIWNGVQLIIIAWYGGNKVDGKWTNAWGWTGEDSTGLS